MQQRNQAEAQGFMNLHISRQKRGISVIKVENACFGYTKEIFIKNVSF